MIEIPERTVLFWSGGKDSTLLLAMLREIGKPFDIVQIRDFWTREQKKKIDNLIKDWKLKVFSFPPMNMYFIGQGNEISFVSEFGLGDGRLPILADVIEGNRCIADLAAQTMPMMPLEWDLYILGSRKDDTHYTFSSPIPSERWQIGGKEFYAPLYSWTREQVIEKSKEYGLDVAEVSEQENTGNLSLCTNCLNGSGEVYCPAEKSFIPAIVWDRGENLRQFQIAYGA